MATTVTHHNANQSAFSVWDTGGCQFSLESAIWAYDFVFDACGNGQKLKCLTIVDESPQECLAIVPAPRICSEHVITRLTSIFSLHRPPALIRSHNGCAFVAKTIQSWLDKQGVSTAYIQPGKP